MDYAFLSKDFIKVTNEACWLLNGNKQVIIRILPFFYFTNMDGVFISKLSLSARFNFFTMARVVDPEVQGSIKRLVSLYYNTHDNTLQWTTIKKISYIQRPILFRYF
jgi:hypothetical protein